MVEQKNPRIGFSLTILIFYLVCAVWIFWEIVEWPGVGNWWLLVYLFIFPAFIYRAFDFFYFLGQKKILKGKWIKLLLIIFSIILGVVLTGLVNKKASLLAMEKFKNNYQPLVEQLQSSPNTLCKILSKFINTQHLYGRKKPKSLHFNGDYFILIFSGGSIDIDGSTIYLDSQTGQWNLFHNDNTKRRSQLEMLVNRMKSCPLEK